jgi:PAS domain S-box-containing protein
MESEARFRELFETSKDGLAVVDLAGLYLDCNQAFLDLLGLGDKGDLLGRPFQEFTPAEFVALEIGLVRQFGDLPVGASREFEKEYLRPSGARIPVEARIWISRDPAGQPAGIWVIARDITERRLAQKQLQELNEGLEDRIRRRTALLEEANAELDAFSYSVSHDLRAPLRGIDGFSHALLEEFGDQLDDQAKHYLTRVRAGTQRMGQLIEGLLRLARVSRTALNRQRLDLSAMALALLEDLRLTDAARPVEFEVEPGLTACGDLILVRSVLENLLGNALKYTAKVPVARIAFYQELQVDGTVAFCVRDNGAGFDMAYAGKLFSPFQRLHSAEEFEGSGIGLSMVQRIVHRHGGHVRVQAEPGMGATFAFTLPGGTDPEPA